MNLETKLCARCHERPRHVRSSGVVISYCGPCHSAAVMASTRKRKARNALEAASARLAPTCPVCHERPRHLYESGRFDGYCRECRNAYQLAFQRRQRREVLDMAATVARPKRRIAGWLERARRLVAAAA